jgi:hypothetical protein
MLLYSSSNMSRKISSPCTEREGRKRLFIVFPWIQYYKLQPWACEAICFPLVSSRKSLQSKIHTWTQTHTLRWKTKHQVVPHSLSLLFEKCIELEFFYWSS